MIDVEDVYKAGDDALGNMTEMEIIPIGDFKLFNMSNKLKCRTTNIEIPSFTVNAYEVHAKTQSFEKPGGKNGTAKTFTSQFRVDKYYVVWKALNAWWQYICSSDTGAMAEDVGAITGTSNIRADIIVKTIDSNGIVTNNGFKFERAWIKDMSSISYDIGSDTPISTSITWSFVKMIPLI